MRIISSHVFICIDKTPILLSSASDLSFLSIFERGTVLQFLNFNSRLVISRTPADQNLEVALEKGICFSIVNSDHIGVTLICDEEYPRRVAFDLLFKILEEFNSFIYKNKINIKTITADTDIKFTYLQTILKEWQNPNEKDNILKLQNELNDVQGIMKKNLQELLSREENLEKLMDKSKDLSTTSVQFYKKAKATNKCCNY